ncbi:MAG: hypothetical protein WBS54_05040 [Acidobacteriota bacterium]
MEERGPQTQLSEEKARRLLGRLMLAWDGQWFLKVAEACGLPKAVELNARVRASFGRIEIREYLKALDRPPAASVEEAVQLLDGYNRIFLGEGMAAQWSVRETGLEVRVTRCFPQEGAAKAGLRPDTPCIACQRVWASWLEIILPGTTWTTEVREAMGRGARSCLILLRQTQKEAPVREEP